MLSHIRLDDITEKDLLALIENKVPENHTLEFKRESYGTNDKAKKEFLKDISAFANADGGDLIIGIAEDENGVAIELSGISKNDAAKELERLEQIVSSGLEPVAHFQSVEITLGGDKVAFIFRILASEIGPHRVKFNNANKFHIRRSKITDEPDLEGLRKMFLAPYLREQRIRAFVEERTKLIIKGDGPALLRSNDWMAIHIVPLRSNNLRFGYAPLTQQQLGQTFHPIGAGGWDYRANLDGVLIHTNEDRDARSYMQIFINGTIEAVCCGLLSERNEIVILPGQYLVKEFINSTYKYVSNLEKIDVQGPFLIFWSLFGMKGATPIYVNEFYSFRSGAKPFDRNLLRIPEIKINNFVDIDDAKQQLRPSLDVLWQAAGYDRCHYFDDEGNWNPPR